MIAKEEKYPYPFSVFRDFLLYLTPEQRLEAFEVLGFCLRCGDDLEMENGDYRDCLCRADD